MALSAALFFAFASALVVQLRKIQECIRSASSSDTDTNELLEKSNSHLFATCEAIRELANYFSLMFLLCISCIFVQTITFSHVLFRMISGQHQQSYIYSIILLFINIFRFFFILNVICYKADQIKDEVRTVTNNFFLKINVTLWKNYISCCDLES